MSETLEQITLRVAKEVGYWEDQEEYILALVRKVVVALGAQEPVAKVSMTHFDDRDWFEINTLKPRETFHNKQPLYAAPVVKESEVVVTTDEDGRAVAVTRQNEEGRILSVIWEAAPEYKP